MAALPPSYARQMERALDLARHRGHRVADSRHLLRMLLADGGSTASLLHRAGADPVGLEHALERSLATCEPATCTAPKPARMLVRAGQDAADLAELWSLPVITTELLLVVSLADPVVAEVLAHQPELGDRLYDLVVDDGRRAGLSEALPLSAPVLVARQSAHPSASGPRRTRQWWNVFAVSGRTGA